MKPIPAIVQPAQIDLDSIRSHLRVEFAGERDDVRIANRHEAEAKRHTESAVSARESASERRTRIGRLLIKARPTWPERGPKAKGWGEFLREFGVSEDSALRYMAEARGDLPQKPTAAGNPVDNSTADRVDREVDPGNKPPQLTLVPDAEPDAEPEVEIDRDTWCTPPWLTEPLGRFDLDPCSNERSTVWAEMALRLERGEDGLEVGPRRGVGCRVFINPPYSKVEPWIEAYKHTRFCFLLKLDTSTKWFAKLHAATDLILIPRRRVNFIPPPGVPKEKAEAQQFPHALFYAHAEDATDAIRALSWNWRIDR